MNNNVLQAVLLRRAINLYPKKMNNRCDYRKKTNFASIISIYHCPSEDSFNLLGGVIMKLVRHYLISDSLDDLEVFEKQLEESCITTPQIHILSLNDSEIAQHDRLNSVQSFLKKDVVHSTELGAVIGICVAVISLVIANLVGWTDTAAGWTPFIFLGILLIGFCTWEGGLIGIETPNHNFTQFTYALKHNKHILFIDINPKQEEILKQILELHPQVEFAGTGSARPNWLIVLENRIPRFFKHTFP